MGRKGRHSKARFGGRLSIVAVISIVLVVLVAGGAFAGYTYDRAQSASILPGVRIQGIDVGGMSRAAAERALAPTAQQTLHRSIQVDAGSKHWQMTAEALGASVNVDAAVDQALSVSSSYNWPTRVYHRLLGRPVSRSIPLPVSYDPSVVSQFAQRVAKTVSLASQDATFDFVDGELVIHHSRKGRVVHQKGATRTLMSALTSEAPSVSIRVSRTKPKVTDKSIGKVIVIRLSQERLYLYDGLKLERTYPVATGQPAYPTPTGRFEVITKEVNPTWVNPARDTWGASEPAEIAPGPGNPLGTRAMALSAPGILIHGTPDDSSIGTAASHGCIRMHMYDVEALFPLVPVGTPVIIAT
jgi:lipoprotein-anchoring transpeptidase ErfK/SrfK